MFTEEELRYHGVDVFEVGGPDDPWLEENRGVFPSTTTARAERHFEATGEVFTIYTKGQEIIDFIEHDLLLGTGDYAGRPFRLMHWQKRMIMEMFEVVWRDVYDIDAGERVGRWIRRNKWAYVQIPKKNGKTEIAAALGLYFLVGEESSVSPNIVCAANSDEQADLVFGAAKAMGDWGAVKTAIVPRSKLLEAPHNLGKFVRLAAVSGANDGKNISTTIIDELHEWLKPNARDIFDIITQGGGARAEYMNIMITTPGFDQDSICYEFYEMVKGVISGEKEDDATLYGLIFEAPEDADHRDPETWRIANPSFDIIVHPEFYADMLTKKSEAVFRRYFCGQWTEAEEVWEAASLWDELAGDPILTADRRTYVGVDIGLRHDTCAVVWCQYDEEKKKFVTDQKIWANPYRRNTSGYKGWKMNVAEVDNFLRDLREKFPKATIAQEDEDDDDWFAPGPGFFYDEHFFARSADILGDEGLNMIAVPQSDTRMVPASQRIFEIIKTGEIEHDGDEIMRKHIRSVVPKEKERGFRINKMDATKAIDGAIALAMAAYYCSEGLEHGSNEAPGIW